MKPAGKACVRKGMGEGDLKDQGRSGQCLEASVPFRYHLRAGQQNESYGAPYTATALCQETTAFHVLSQRPDPLGFVRRNQRAGGSHQPLVRKLAVGSVA